MKKFVLIGSLVLLGASLSVIALPDAIQAGTFTAFAKDYTCAMATPGIAGKKFWVSNPHTAYTLHIYNGGKNNQFKQKAWMGIIRLNGSVVSWFSEFIRPVSHVKERITLKKCNNELTATIFGKRESGITIEIIGVDNDPPTIVAALAPSPNDAGWNKTNVTVGFQCSDKTSGIASCPDSVLVMTEGAGQVITGHATDKAGNTATTSVAVNLDKTPPSVAVTQPPNGAFLQDSSVIVQGTANDSFSGVAAVTCNGTPASLSNSSFTCNVSLVMGDNILQTVATDVAGNVAHSIISVAFLPPVLELAYVDDMQLVWWDKGSGGSFDGAYWRPIVPDGFYALGHYGEGDYSNPPRGFMFAVRELKPGALARPVDYVKVWDDRGSGADLDGSFWRPIPPTDYVCLGLVGQSGWSKPNTDEIMCVRQDLVAPGKVGNTIWIDQETHADVDFGSWQIIPADENGIYIGTFTGNNSHSIPPTDSLFTIDARIVKRYEIGSDDIGQLIEQYGPDLLLAGHGYVVPPMPEEYFLDSPEYVLDRVGLEWALVQNETSYGSFNFTFLGSHPTSAAGLMQDVESYVRASPEFGNPFFRYYLRIDDSLKPGNLDRAKALVRVRPWNWLFTDLQFWLFYPFNGPGRAEVCASGNWCDIQFFDELGRHYGDWECVTLRVDNRTEELISVYMSRHAGGQWITRGNNFEQILQFEGTHPQVYAALHSHAHYSTPGAHDYYRAWEKDYWLGTASVDLRDLTDGDGPVFSTHLPGKYLIVSSALPGYVVTEPEWLQFRGRWGQYERLSDDFRLPDSPIPVYTYTEVGSGPSGPAMKTSWERGDSSEHWWWTRNLEGHEACFDGVDNDGDGEIDCHDPGCWQVDPVCIHEGWYLCHVAPELFGPCPP